MASGQRESAMMAVVAVATAAALLAVMAIAGVVFLRQRRAKRTPAALPVRPVVVDAPA